MKIYVARGDETLGPYDPEEAAGLIERGQLFPADFAARNGDPEWVPLSSFLPPPAPVPAHMLNGHAGAAAPTLRWPWLPSAIIVLAGLLVVGVPFVFFLWSDNPRREPPARPGPAPPSPLPVERSIAMPEVPDEPLPQPSVERSEPVPSVNITIPTPAAKGGEIDGTISLPARDGVPVKFAGVCVSVYPVEALEPSLARKTAAVQATLARLAPEIEAAEAEKTARAAAEQSALRAFLDADPSDVLRSSLEFAHAQAKAALKAADTDCQYLLDQRREAMDGALYFGELPAPVVTAESDAEGRFTLKLPAGGVFAVAACASQETGTGMRKRYWLVKVTVADGSKKDLALSGANVASASSTESLIVTAD